MSTPELIGVSRGLQELLNTGLVKTVFQPLFEETGLLAGDVVRGWRARNLGRVLERTERKLRDKGLGTEDINAIKMTVGLPLIEKASCQDDEVLQDMWANLIVSGVTEDGKTRGFSLDVTYVEILAQFSRVDCEALTFLVEEAFDGLSFDEQGVDFVHFRDVSRSDLRSRIENGSIVLDKLIALGCVEKDVDNPLRGDRFHRVEFRIRPTLIGLNLYLSASGRTLRELLRRKNDSGDGGNSGSQTERVRPESQRHA